MDTEPTNTEILSAINSFSTKVDARFDDIEKVIGTLKSDVGTIKATLTTMPTRDDLSEKLADTKGDIIATMRKEDTKLRTLVEVLREKNVLGDHDVKRILSLEPFPQLFV